MTAPDPKQRTSAPPQLIDGVTFHCYRTGISRFAWISEDGRCYVSRNRYTGTGSTYGAAVDGLGVPGSNPKKAKRFLSITSAMLGAVLYSKRPAG